MEQLIGDMGTPSWWDIVCRQLQELCVLLGPDVEVQHTVIGAPSQTSTMAQVCQWAQTTRRWARDIDHPDLAHEQYGAAYAIETTVRMDTEAPSVTQWIWAHGQMYGAPGGDRCIDVLASCRNWLDGQAVATVAMGFRQDMWWPRVLSLAAAGGPCWQFELIQPTTTLVGAAKMMRIAIAKQLSAGPTWVYPTYAGGGDDDEHETPHNRLVRLRCQVARSAPFLPRLALEDLGDTIAHCVITSPDDLILQRDTEALIAQLMPLAERTGLHLERQTKRRRV
jgi:hypothetical protein